jgi:cobalt-precorrin 5A hydrolase
MKLAILTLTQGGLSLGKQLKQYYPEASLFTLGKYKEEGVLAIKPSLQPLVGNLFVTYDALCFIMATGIVVRTIAPFIQDKTIDPAVLVMDEKGNYVISLLSGHIGNANAWAKEIASKIKATPIITTSSDLNGIMAMDTLAIQLNCSIDNMEKAKQLTTMLLEGKKVGIINKASKVIMVEPPFVLLKEEQEIEQLPHIEGLVYITKTKPIGGDLPYVWFVPRDIIVSIGCRRGVTKEALKEVLHMALTQIQISILEIRKITTVVIKKDEVGLLQLARELNVPIEYYPIEQIKEVEHLFQGSAFVKQTLGVQAVSEPCGYLGSNLGNCLLPVQKIQGITISIWKEKDNAYNLATV